MSAGKNEERLPMRMITNTRLKKKDGGTRAEPKTRGAALDFEASASDGPSLIPSEDTPTNIPGDSPFSPPPSWKPPRNLPSEEEASKDEQARKEEASINGPNNQPSLTPTELVPVDDTNASHDIHADHCVPSEYGHFRTKLQPNLTTITKTQQSAVSYSHKTVIQRAV